MDMAHHRGRPHRFAALVAMLIGVAACSSPPSPTATPLPTGAATASQAATEAPSPTPVPDVSAAFRTQFAAISSGVMELSGQATVGPVQLTVTGTTTFNGLDSSDVSTTTVSGVATIVNHVQTGGKRYVKKGNGPWLVDTSPAPSGSLSKELARVAALVTDAGLDTHGGLPAHRLVPPAGTVFDPSTLGLGSSAAADATVTVIFFAEDDGTPVAVNLDATWSQAAGGATVAVHMVLDIALSQLGVTHVIRVPDHVWTSFKSKRFGFRIAYPDDFDYSKGKTVDFFTGPFGQYVGGSRQSTRGFSLNSIVSQVSPAIKRDFHAKSVKNEAFTLAGAKARLLTFSGGVNSAKVKVVLYDVWCVKGSYVYELFWVSAVGNEANDLAAFKQILATFAFS
jgi:hypothetical protein